MPFWGLLNLLGSDANHGECPYKHSVSTKRPKHIVSVDSKGGVSLLIHLHLPPNPYHSTGTNNKRSSLCGKSPGREPTAHLHKQWAQIIRRATKGFLAILNTYHRSCAQQLRLQDTDLESSIAARLGEARAKRFRDCQTSLCQKRSPSTGRS